MDFYFNTNMDSTYVEKYSTLVCFNPSSYEIDRGLYNPYFFLHMDFVFWHFT
jgi:hypothetical protein